MGTLSQGWCVCADSAVHDFSSVANAYITLLPPPSPYSLLLMVCTLSLILIPYSKVVPYGIPLADERTTREAEFRQLAVGMTKPKATEIESPPHNCPANPMAS